MQATDVSTRRDSIAKLSISAPHLALLPAMPAALAPTPPTTQPSGYVDDGSMVSFVAGVNQQHQQDALNSTLLAQLAANAQYDRTKDTVNWYKAYAQVLETVGWQVQNFNFNQFEASGNTFTVDAVVLQLLSSIATQDELAIAKATIDALQGLDKGDGRLALFNSASHPASNGNFQLAAAVESNNILMLKVGAFYFYSNETTTDFLWWHYSSSDTKFWQGGQVMNLNDQVYGQVRQQIIDKLGSHAKTAIQNLPLKI